jgi:hypothetical protein
MEYCSRDSLRDKKKPVKKEIWLRKVVNVFNEIRETYSQKKMFGEK